MLVNGSTGWVVSHGDGVSHSVAGIVVDFMTIPTATQRGVYLPPKAAWYCGRIHSLETRFQAHPEANSRPANVCRLLKSVGDVRSNQGPSSADSSLGE